jgi:hypothetical protein
VFFGSAIRAQLGIMQANYFARAHQAIIGQATMALEPTGMKTEHLFRLKIQLLKS